MAYLNDFEQSHYVIYELVLPYCTVCTPRENIDGTWHTPPMCVESSDAEYSLFFTRNNAPFSSPPSQSIGIKSKLNSTIWRCVSGASVTTSKAKAGGLASRGTMSLTCTDITGDPGPIEFTDEGTLFGKLMARNILEGKKIITHYYSIGRDEVTPVEVRTETHYVTNATLSAGVFTLNAKDALKDLEAFSQQFPTPGEVTLTADIDDTQVTFDVSDATDFPADTYFRMGSELFRVNSVAGNSITVDARGHTRTSSIDGRVLYKSNKESHDAESTLQPCRLLDGEPLADTLQAIFNEVGLHDFVNYTQWNDDITQWDGDAKLWGIMSEPEDASDLIDDLLEVFLVDMWLDQTTQKAFISTNSNWKQPEVSFIEGTDVQNYKVTTRDNTRFSRAYILAGKAYQADNDDNTNYSRLISSTDVESETSDFYGSVKLKEFDPVQWISGDSATRLTSRYIQRYSDTPREVTFDIEERKINGITIGSVIEVVSIDKQSPSGATLTSNDRVQILKLQPNLNGVGRKYTATALAYTPLFAADPNEEQFVTLTGSIRSINLATYVGAPTNIPLNYTFIFDGCEIGSAEESSTWLAAVRAGAWHPDSRIRIICTNKTLWSAKGGNGSSITIPGFNANQLPAASILDPANGSNSYESNGIETEIYLNYGNVIGYETNSTLFAAGGGGGGGVAYSRNEEGGGFVFATAFCMSVSSGGGGNGIPIGFAGEVLDSVMIPVKNIKTALDGGFDFGGESFESPANDRDRAGEFEAEANTNIIPTDGGNSSSSLNPSGSSDGVEKYFLELSSNAEAGYSFVGGGITVYNLSSESAKFKPGRSVAGVDYTLIDS